jgi:hypothetical protein
MSRETNARIEALFSKWNHKTACEWTIQL